MTTLNRKPLRPSRTMRVALTAAAVILSALVAPAGQAASSMATVTVYSPQKDQVVTGDRVLISLQVDSPYGLSALNVDLYPYDDDYPDESWTFYDDADPADEEHLPCSGSECRFSVTLGSFSDGPGFLEFSARDRNGVWGPITEVPVTFSRTVSTAALYAPTPGTELSGRVRLLALPQGNATSVRFYIDGVMLDGRPQWHDNDLMYQEWDTRQRENGTHTVAVGGFDGNADPPGPPITVTVKNAVGASIQLTANRDQWGDIQSMSATLTDPNGQGIGSRQINMVAQWPSRRISIDPALTNATGVARFDVALRPPVRLTATFDGDSEYAPAQVTTMIRGRLAADYQITVKQARVGADYFNLLTLSEPVQIRFERQYLTTSGAWKVSRTYRTNRYGTWKGKFHGTQVGTGTFRIVVPESEWWEAAISNTQTVRWTRRSD